MTMGRILLTNLRFLSQVSRCQAKIGRPLTDEDFVARHKFSFDMSVFRLLSTLEMRLADFDIQIQRRQRAHALGQV